LRDRPEFLAPAALGAGANPAARDVFERATDSRAAWLARSASFCAAILDSIGDANRLAIADPDTDTLHPSSLPARHHHCHDGAPRDDDGCRGRRVAFTPEEECLKTKFAISYGLWLQDIKSGVKWTSKMEVRHHALIMDVKNVH
jgi:hypothetical protein